MKVEKVPREVSTLEIYNAYCRHGNIVRIEKVTDAAYIVFRSVDRS